MCGALGAGLGGGEFPPKVVRIDSRQSGVSIGGTYHAKLVRINAEFLLQFQAIPQSRASVFELKHLWLFLLAKVEVPFVPALIVRKFIVWREKRVSFAVALDLGYFVKSFAKGAGFSILAVYRLSGERLDDGEHTPIADIAVVRDGKHMATGFFFVPAHPLPQVAGIIAAERLLRRIRFNEAGSAPIVAKNNVAVKVVPASGGSPLVADERGKAARIIGLLR